MDTYMTLRVYGTDTVPDTLSQELFRLDRQLSATRPDSLLTQLNEGGSLTCEEPIAALLRESLGLSARTDGALDPSVYPAVQLWGFPTDEFHVPTQAELDAVKPYIGTDHIHLDGSTVRLDEGTRLDFGAVAKGYAARRCVALLEQAGVSAALLSLGGNIQTYGSKPDGDWCIGITDPMGQSDCFATLHLQGSHAIVTSGSYQRSFTVGTETYHHILDPETCRSADSGLLSVTVVCADGLLADGLSTALFVMGLERAAKLYQESCDFEAVFYLEDGTVYLTQGLTEVYSGREYEVIAR